MATATITAGNTYVDVTHELGFTPDLNKLYVRAKDDLGGRSLWTSDENTTTFRINISSPDLVDHQFGWDYPYAAAAEGTVTPTRVRNRLNLSPSDVNDEIVTEFIQDACATVERATDRTIDYNDCDQDEASCITDLAAIYVLCFVSGGTATGMTFKMGDLNADVLDRAPQVDILAPRVEAAIERLREPYVGRV